MLSQPVCSVLITQFSSMGFSSGCLFYICSFFSHTRCTDYSYFLWLFKIWYKIVYSSPWHFHWFFNQKLFELGLHHFYLHYFFAFCGISSLSNPSRKIAPAVTSRADSLKPSFSENTQASNFLGAEITWFHLSANP